MPHSECHFLTQGTCQRRSAATVSRHVSAQAASSTPPPDAPLPVHAPLAAFRRQAAPYAVRCAVDPLKGACLMELASYLAGERWSDHPACTHPLLASVARLVNDHTSDQGRPNLAELIPSVIGLTGDDLHIDALITLRCATIALPVAAADRQRVLAVSILVCERVLAQLDGRPENSPLQIVSAC